MKNKFIKKEIDKTAKEHGQLCISGEENKEAREIFKDFFGDKRFTLETYKGSFDKVHFKDKSSKTTLKLSCSKFFKTLEVGDVIFLQVKDANTVLITDKEPKYTEEKKLPVSKPDATEQKEQAVSFPIIFEDDIKEEQTLCQTISIEEFLETIIAQPKSKEKVSKQYPLMQHTLQALKELGGSASVKEINKKVCEIANISDEMKIKTSASGMNELYNNLREARDKLKKAQLVENPQREIWALKSGINPELFNLDSNNFAKITDYLRTKEDSWQNKLLAQINSFPKNGKGFENLSKVLLKQYGFSNVEVVGGRGDKGIDGRGIYKVDNNFFNIPFVFQCKQRKQWKQKIQPKEIRDFRGAMDGKTTFGIFITTGDFSDSAKQEAKKQFASATIKLINRDLLCEMMKKKSMGIKGVFRVHNELEITLIDEKWFEQFKK